MKRAVALLAVAGGVLALDQWTKQLATLHLAGRPPVEVLGDFAKLTYALNSGVAFSLGAGSRFPFYLFSIAAAVVILWLLARGKVPRTSQQIALALILGGALGNLVDRITTGLVVDFIEIGIDRYRWPVFNVADSAVSIGVVLFILLGSTHPPRATAAAAAGEAPGGAHPNPHEPEPRTYGDAGGSGGATGSLPGERPGGPVA